MEGLLACRALSAKTSLAVVQSSFAKRYLMNAMFGWAWAVAVVMGG